MGLWASWPIAHGWDVYHLQGELPEPPCFDSPEAAHEETDMKKDATQFQSAIGLILETGKWSSLKERLVLNKHKKANGVK